MASDDDTGYVQPTLEEARVQREDKSSRHWNNNIRAWAVRADGSVGFGLV